MSADPRNAAEQNDGERRNRPDNELDAAGMGPIGMIDSAAIGLPKPECEREDGGDRRQYDREHDRNGVDQDCFVGGSDRTLWIKDVHR